MKVKFGTIFLAKNFLNILIPLLFFLKKLALFEGGNETLIVKEFGIGGAPLIQVAQSFF